MLEKWPGVAPVLLHHQVKNTAPFIFGIEWKDFCQYLRLVSSANQYHEPHSMALFDYFCLLASAHYATVATFVPTDLDNSIRQKLWNQMKRDDRLRAAQWVIQSYAYNFFPVSTRWIKTPSGETLHGHHGEWFSLAAASFGACRSISVEMANQIREAIRTEVFREARIFAEFYAAGGGLDLCLAATLVSHNLGDLDRVIDAWHLQAETVGLGELYRLGHRSSGKTTRWLKIAGDINKAMTAEENHRHLPLRKPRCLRRYSDLLLPVGPFFDDWGERVARHPGLLPQEIGEIAEALIDGWNRIGGIGYARALRGIETGFAGGAGALEKEMPAKSARYLRTGPLRRHITEDRQRFERKWAQRALFEATKAVVNTS